MTATRCLDPDTIILPTRKAKELAGDLIVDFKVTTNAGKFFINPMKNHHFQIQNRLIKSYLPGVWGCPAEPMTLKSMQRESVQSVPRQKTKEYAELKIEK